MPLNCLQLHSVAYFKYANEAPAWACTSHLVHDMSVPFAVFGRSLVLHSHMRRASTTSILWVRYIDSCLCPAIIQSIDFSHCIHTCTVSAAGCSIAATAVAANQSKRMIS